MLVSRILKARYFPEVHILNAAQRQGSSFIWQGLWQAKEILCKGFRWVVGDGHSIKATKDPWLAKKIDFRVENHLRYEGRNEIVSSLFYPGTKLWHSDKVFEQFNIADAKAILATSVPQHSVEDRIVWSMSTDGLYNVKTGYHFWHNRHVGNSLCTRSGGWNKLWRLTVPHKLKVFLWRFCRNNIPVRHRLRSKGVLVTIQCPMCSIDVEHLLHVFFDCPFAKSCWQAVGFSLDMSQVYSAPEWLLSKLDTSNQAESVKLTTVLWGIWFWRNKKVWEDKSVTAEIAMELSFNNVNEWRKARTKVKPAGTETCQSDVTRERKWSAPPSGLLKINVDASIFPEADTFSVGMVMRDQNGMFVEAKVIALPCPATVMEAESIGVKEALSWAIQRGDDCVIIESDSLLTVRALQGNKSYLLEVGHVVEQCKLLLQSAPGFVVTHIRKQANKVAHSLARIPCSINCFHVFTSPPSQLLETLKNDFPY